MTTSTSTVTEAANRLRLTVMRLSRRLRQQEEGPITPSQVSALHSIEKFGPVTLGELAAAERVQPPSMTRIVAALEEHGYVVREVDAADRRVSRLHLTAQGRRTIERGRSRRTAFLAARLKRLAPDDLATLERALPLLEAMLEDEQ
jgi:DNA-binding MarR family transcriptional regulator